jgi:hypothetical protein
MADTRTKESKIRSHRFFIIYNITSFEYTYCIDNFQFKGTRFVCIHIYTYI